MLLLEAWLFLVVKVLITAKSNNTDIKSVKTGSTTSDNNSANNKKSDKNNTSAENLGKDNNSAQKSNLEADKNNNTSLSERPLNKNKNGVPATKEKVVSYVDETGKVLGTGKITVTTNGTQTVYSVDKTIPAGYALKNQTDLKKYPDQLTVVPSATSKEASSASVANETNAAENANPTPTADGAGADKDTTTTTTPSSSTTDGSAGTGSGTTAATLPQTGNTHFERSAMLGAVLVTVAGAAAGLRKKQ